MYFASIRVQKQHKTDLRKVANHNQRLVEENYIDDGRTHLNKVVFEKYEGMDTEKAVLHDIENRVGGKAPRKDAVYANELVLSASPDYFFPQMRALNQDVDFSDKKAVEKIEDRGDLSQERLDDWLEIQTDLLKKTYGKNLIRVDLHLDEKTPHLHAITVPIMEKEMSKRRTAAQIKSDEAKGINTAEKYTVERLDDKTMSNKFNGIHGYRKLQTDLGQDPRLEALGIKRGVEGSRATHTNLKDYRKALEKGFKEIPPIQHYKTPDVPMKNNFIGQEVVDREAAQALIEKQAKIINHIGKMHNNLANEINNEIAAKNMVKLELERKEKTFEGLAEKSASLDVRSKQLSDREGHLNYRETMVNVKSSKVEAQETILKTLQTFLKNEKGVEVTDREIDAAVKVGIKNHRAKSQDKEKSLEIGD